MLTCHYATQFSARECRKAKFCERSNGILSRKFSQNYKLLQSTLVSFQFSSIVWGTLTAVESFNALTTLRFINFVYS